MGQIGQIVQPSYPKPPRRDDEVVSPSYPPPSNPTKSKIERTHEIADRLESEANKNCNKIIEKAKAYCDGYIQGVEDYSREMRELLREK